MFLIPNFDFCRQQLGFKDEKPYISLVQIKILWPQTFSQSRSRSFGCRHYFNPDQDQGRKQFLCPNRGHRHFCSPDQDPLVADISLVHIKIEVVDSSFIQIEVIGNFFVKIAVADSSFIKIEVEKSIGRRQLHYQDQDGKASWSHQLSRIISKIRQLSVRSSIFIFVKR